MIAQLFDRDRNAIGTVEYVNISKEPSLEPYRQYLPEDLFKEEPVKYNAGGVRLSGDKIRSFQREPQNCIVVVDFNGVYFRHRIEYRFMDKRYDCLKRTDGPPSIPPDQVVVESKERTEAILKAHRERFIPKDIDQLLKDWDAMFLEFNNVVTRIFDKNGKLVGNIEEGLDTFLQLNLQVAKRRYFRTWHYVKDKKVRDLKTFKGMENAKFSTYLGYDNWFNPLFPDKKAKEPEKK